MHRQMIACEKTIVAGAVTILPVVKTSLTTLQIGGSINFHAVRQPVYIVVYLKGEVAIYNLSGEVVPISRAKSECPGLVEALEECHDFQLPPGW